MNPLALGAALGAAAIGALAWGLVGFYTGYEIGYLAWGVGALVGFAAAIAGGRDVAMGVACALFALGSIFAGKLIATRWIVDREIDRNLREEITAEMHTEFTTDAADFARLQSDADLPRFLVDHGYTEAESPAAVTGADIAVFRATHEPRLRWLHEHQPTREEWIAHEIEVETAEMGSMESLVSLTIDGLSPIDILFAFLGIATAFRLGKRGWSASASGSA